METVFLDVFGRDKPARQMLMSIYPTANLDALSEEKARLFNGWSCERFRP
jgi:hypothetical protein